MFLPVIFGARFQIAAFPQRFGEAKDGTENIKTVVRFCMTLYDVL